MANRKPQVSEEVARVLAHMDTLTREQWIERINWVPDHLRAREEAERAASAESSVAPPRSTTTRSSRKAA